MPPTNYNDFSKEELLAIKKLPGCSFGPPPDPERPKPRFIGLPPSKFNAIDAEHVYRHEIFKETNRRVSVEAAARLLSEDGQVAFEAADQLCDTVPGGRSIGRTYARMGYTLCPLTMRLLIPKVHGSTPQETDGGMGTMTLRSGASMRRPQSVAGLSPSARPNTGSSRGSRRNAAALIAATEGLGRTPPPLSRSSAGEMARCGSAPAGDFGSMGHTPWSKLPGLALSPLDTACSLGATSIASTAYAASLIRGRHAKNSRPGEMCPQLTIG